MLISYFSFSDTLKKEAVVTLYSEDPKLAVPLETNVSSSLI